MKLVYLFISVLVAPCSSSGIASNPLHYNSEGWIGHPLDPVGALFDTLAESSLVPETKSFDQYYGKEWHNFILKEEKKIFLFPLNYT